MADPATTQLAAELRTARDRLGRSLRSVATEADISAAYLQKLERSQVATPSPRILERLAEVLGLDYRRLMRSAGFAPVDERVGRTRGRGLGLEAKLASAHLTEVEERAVVAFVESLVAQRSTTDTRRGGET